MRGAAKPRRPADLPIDAVMGEIVAAARGHGAVVIVAPPGSGKTTRVPPAFLDAGIAGAGKILVLQPRRVAARATARWMAAERGGEVGGEIGYAIRFERRIGSRTRIEVVTEGLLTRRLQRDPFLDGVGAVIIDEFHERSLHADLALAMVAEIRRDAREDLVVAVMSATLNAGPVAAFLAGAPVIRCDGRLHPVEIEFAPGPAGIERDRHTAAMIVGCIAQMREGRRPAGDLLCFLPGVAAISRTARALVGRTNAEVLPLHGRLSHRDQDRALRPGDDPRAGPRVILATNIAETSITLPGVSCVVDSGRARVIRIDRASGLPRLVEERISRASAEQRTGRAGRTGPGWCVRLWSEPDGRAMKPFLEAEIRRTDLCRTLLEVRAWGRAPGTFEWFEAPPGAEVQRAEGILRDIGALSDAGLTEMGQTIVAWPVHPRIGAVLLAGVKADRTRHAAGLAALIEEGDVLVRDLAIAGDDDVEVRLAALDEAEKSGFSERACRRLGLVVQRARRFAAVRDALVRAVRAKPGDAVGSGQVRDRSREVVSSDSALVPSDSALVLAGFADRVARRRPQSSGTQGSDRLVLVGGHGARLSASSAVRDARLVVAVAMRAGARGAGADHVIDIACAISQQDLLTTVDVHTRFDAERGAVVTTKRTLYRDLVLAEHPVAIDAEAAEAVLAAAARGAPVRALCLNRDEKRLLGRIRWLAGAMPSVELPLLRELDTPNGAADGLLPIVAAACAGCRSFEELGRVKLAPLIRAALSSAQSRALAEHAPERATLPHGRSARIDYEGGTPTLAAKIQHLFGVGDAPRVAGGRVAVVVELLAPNGRPAQVTSDLAAFWVGSYRDVRKQLRGRYPKHAWPVRPTLADGLRRRRRKPSR